jgi:xanthine dehydrogenase molybdopterin-binding subunit B
VLVGVIVVGTTSLGGTFGSDEPQAASIAEAPSVAATTRRREKRERTMSDITKWAPDQ